MLYFCLSSSPPPFSSLRMHEWRCGILHCIALREIKGSQQGSVIPTTYWWKGQGKKKAEEKREQKTVCSKAQGSPTGVSRPFRSFPRAPCFVVLKRRSSAVLRYGLAVVSSTIHLSWRIFQLPPPQRASLAPTMAVL